MKINVAAAVVKTYVATKNAGKLAEMRAIFAGSVLELETYADYAAVVEDAGDYVGNALLKARGLAGALSAAHVAGAVLADDSGLEVDALDGRPGIYSARYAGAETSWERRRAQLLAELSGLPETQRDARFVSALVLILAGGDVLSAVGFVEGRIVEAARGSGGFGYDPVFLYPPRGCTFAELSAADKNAVSHRRRAADALLAALRERA
ncbi:MAG TPA: RdgB/HAM1 family non-canonical purine NTP pyrophosphatase [Candidatus Tumulicola sp.]